MRNFITAAGAAVVAISLFSAPLAFAQSTSAQASDMSLGQIETRLTDRGFRVLEIERDDGHYEVKALNPQGQCVELDVDRRSGDVLRTKTDDDCGVDDRHRHRGGRHS
ncbi:MAG: PepSY domain-containing protein [Hyphomonadaceae bacterium]